MYKIMSIFGTRPEAIKMCPLAKFLENDPRFNSRVLVTGQHREILDSALKIFDIKPHYDLNLMKHGQTITDIAGEVLNRVYRILQQEKPHMILVHGDTSTAFYAAQAAFYLHIPIGHVEAGLRSGSIDSPFPEEFNRRGIGMIASLHLSPTEGNKRNLLKENVSPEHIIVTGNTVIDALKMVLVEDYQFEDPLLNMLDYSKKIILLTCHRRENQGEPMKNIFQTVYRIIQENPDTELIFPVHPNPKVKNPAQQILGNRPRIHLIKPLDYVPFANLMNRAYLILTDSGGIQEEAPALGKPVVVLRTETERPEALEANTVKIAGIKKENIYQAVTELLADEEKYKIMAHAVNPYGDGTACQKSADAVFNYLNNYQIGKRRLL